MQKLFKITLIFILIFLVHTGFANAETTNLYNNIQNENTSNTSTSQNSNTTENNTVSNDTINDNFLLEDDFDLPNDTNSTNYRSSTTPSGNSNARINTVSSIPEANLGLNNILCIILIALGILIALLAIAILIRLKK